MEFDMKTDIICQIAINYYKNRKYLNKVNNFPSDSRISVFVLCYNYKDREDTERYFRTYLLHFYPKYDYNKLRYHLRFGVEETHAIGLKAQTLVLSKMTNNSIYYRNIINKIVVRMKTRFQNNISLLNLDVDTRF